MTVVYACKLFQFLATRFASEKMNARSRRNRERRAIQLCEISDDLLLKCKCFQRRWHQRWRSAVERVQISGVVSGCVRGNRMALDQCNPQSASRETIRSCASDDAAANNRNVTCRRSRHVTRPAKVGMTLNHKRPF